MEIFTLYTLLKIADTPKRHRYILVICSLLSSLHTPPLPETPFLFLSGIICQVLVELYTYRAKNRKERRMKSEKVGGMWNILQKCAYTHKKWNEMKVLAKAVRT